MRHLFSRRRPLQLRTVIAIALVHFSACSGDEARGAAAGRNPSTDSAAVSRSRRGVQDTILALLTHPAGGPNGDEYTAVSNEALQTISGVVSSASTVPGDSLITPTLDPQACKPFRDVAMPRRGDGVGNAIVWLVGVTRGRAQDLPLRTTIRLNDCHLEPRVQRVAAGGTVLMNSRDAMDSRLRVFYASGDPASPLTLISFNDVGQVVPDDKMARNAGLVEIRDDKHPWVHGYLAVSPHPFVVVTEADGEFEFEGVPAGRYTLVVFSEKLGVRRTEITVGSQPVRADVRY